MNGFSFAHKILFNQHHRTSDLNNCFHWVLEKPTTKSTSLQVQKLTASFQKKKIRQMKLYLPDPVCNYSLDMAIKTPRTAIRATLDMNRKWSTSPTWDMFVFLQFCPYQVNQKHVRNEHIKVLINYSENHLNVVILSSAPTITCSPFYLFGGWEMRWRSWHFI